MKTTFTLLLCALFSVTNAQFTLIADYPFTSDGVDLISGDEAFLLNATFAEGGIYSNGIYAGNNPETGTEIRTTQIDEFNFSNFKFTVEFRVDSLPQESWMPIVVGGPSWRWAAVTMQDDGLLAFRANNGSDLHVSDQMIALGVWHDLEVEYNGSTMTVWLNEMEVMNIALEQLVNGGDSRFICSENSLGRNLKGYWRNLKIYSTITTDIENAGSKNSIVFPNPAAENIQLSGWVREGETNTIQLLGTDGKVVRVFAIQSDPSTIDVSGITPGVYFLKLEDESGKVQRLVLE